MLLAAATVGVCMLYYSQRIALEEALLEERFGIAYERYREEVPCKYLPGLF